MPEQTSIPRVVIAGIGSGAGKTTVALGLAGALRRRGRIVQTFKVGPNQVDCAHLAHASRRPCRNLDSWMLGRGGVVRSFVNGVRDADCAVVEGTMGLFEGHGGATTAGVEKPGFPGSTAEVAALVGSPVLLVVDLDGRAETAAALVLGALPRLAHVQVSGLRSGLLPLTRDPSVNPALDELTAAVQRHCDVELIERLMTRARPVQNVAAGAIRPSAVARRPVRVGVAFDEAFCFYNAENLELLEAAGAEIVTFSPLDDGRLPNDLGTIYMGGGLSELVVPGLAANRGFIESLKHSHDRGVPIYAEGGGLVYCARSVSTSDGARHAMAALMPADVALEAGVVHTGYRDLRVAADGILAPAGTSLRGHEFHFGRVLSGLPQGTHAYSMHDVEGEPLGCEGWSTSTLFASLVQVHFGQDSSLAERLVAAGAGAAQRPAERARS